MNTLKSIVKFFELHKSYTWLLAATCFAIVAFLIHPIFTFDIFLFVTILGVYLLIRNHEVKKEAEAAAKTSTIQASASTTTTQVQ